MRGQLREAGRQVGGAVLQLTSARIHLAGPGCQLVGAVESVLLAGGESCSTVGKFTGAGVRLHDRLGECRCCTGQLCGAIGHGSGSVSQLLDVGGQLVLQVRDCGEGSADENKSRI
nr:hypothetical protein [Arthrobacter sp. PAMC 25486]